MREREREREREGGEVGGGREVNRNVVSRLRPHSQKAETTIWDVFPRASGATRGRV